MAEDIRPGVVIRVSGWPGTQGRRFEVERLVENPLSAYPRQVYCRQLDRGRVTVFRAFPIENCRVDRKLTRLRQAVTAMLGMAT